MMEAWAKLLAVEMRNGQIQDILWRKRGQDFVLDRMGVEIERTRIIKMVPLGSNNWVSGRTIC